MSLSFSEHPTQDQTTMVRRSSGEQAALYIRRLIFDGTLRPGTRVPQDQIARDLGISRIPIREALIALEREGWVTNQLHRGTFVNALEEGYVRDHYALFGRIYGFAVKAAVERNTGDLAKRLGEVHDAIMQATDPSEIARLTIRFHSVIVVAAASPPAEVLLRALSGLVPGNVFAQVPKGTEIERKGLTAIYRAVKAGDGDRAAEACTKMLHQVGEQVVILFRERGLFDTAEIVPVPRKRQKS